MNLLRSNEQVPRVLRMYCCVSKTFPFSRLRGIMDSSSVWTVRDQLVRPVWKTEKKELYIVIYLFIYLVIYIIYSFE